jgi:hypothetical protein
MNQQFDQQQKRQIFRAWALGISPPTLSETYGGTVAEIEEVLREAKSQRPSLEEIDARELLEDHRIRAEAIQEALGIAATKAKQPRERIAASKVQFEVLRHLFNVDREIGILPSDLGFFGFQYEIEIILKKICGALRKNEVDEVVWEELITLFDPKEWGPDDHA